MTRLNGVYVLASDDFDSHFRPHSYPCLQLGCVSSSWTLRSGMISCWVCRFLRYLRRADPGAERLQRNQSSRTQKDHSRLGAFPRMPGDGHYLQLDPGFRRGGTAVPRATSLLIRNVESEFRRWLFARVRGRH